MSDSRPPEAIHGLLMCSERIAQEENFNGGHMTLEEGVFFRMGKGCWEELRNASKKFLDGTGYLDASYGGEGVYDPMIYIYICIYMYIYIYVYIYIYD